MKLYLSADMSGVTFIPTIFLYEANEDAYILSVAWLFFEVGVYFG